MVEGQVLVPGADAVERIQVHSRTHQGVRRGGVAVVVAEDVRVLAQDLKRLQLHFHTMSWCSSIPAERVGIVKRIQAEWRSLVGSVGCI